MAGAFRQPLLADPLVQNIHVDIGKQGRQDAALRGAVLVYLTFSDNSSFQHGLDDLQQPLVLNTHMVQALYQDAVVDAVKAFADVALHYPVIPCFVDVVGYALERHLCVPHGPESEGVSVKLRLHNGFQYNSDTLLHNPVPDGGDAERTFFCLPRFVDIHPAYLFWGEAGKCPLNIPDNPLIGFLEVVPLHLPAVHTGRFAALVGFDIVYGGLNSRFTRHEFDKSFERRPMACVPR